ncbi:hypothetical protein AAFF_G00114690 [Aldrovandia affinis]|uniref:Uncharacterized protein n=1 Tax=Aldrovandia affinis TaxID=143900 RepID=A0AAD7RTA9_9TELE|nr:hypothetical protein AAFF_G00114690 [Aldrovandia affinis]
MPVSTLRPIGERQARRPRGDWAGPGGRAVLGGGAAGEEEGTPACSSPLLPSRLGPLRATVGSRHGAREFSRQAPGEQRCRHSFGAVEGLGGGAAGSEVSGRGPAGVRWRGVRRGALPVWKRPSAVIAPLC